MYGQTEPVQMMNKTETEGQAADDAKNPNAFSRPSTNHLNPVKEAAQARKYTVGVCRSQVGRRYRLHKHRIMTENEL